MDNVYKIVIQYPSEDGESKIVSGNFNPTLPEESKRMQGAEKAMKKMVSYAAVRGFANTLISYEISQVNLRTGAYEYEQRLRTGYQFANQGLNIITSTVMGAKMGGPAGAAVAFIGSTLYTLLGYAQKENTLRTQENLENISIGMASIRAGVSGRRGMHQ